MQIVKVNNQIVIPNFSDFLNWRENTWLVCSETNYIIAIGINGENLDEKFEILIKYFY